MPQKSTTKQFINQFVKAALIDAKQAEQLFDCETIHEVSSMAVKLFGISEEEIAKQKAIFFTLPYVDLVGKKVSSAVLNLIPRELADTYQVVSFNFSGSLLDVGIVDPTNLKSQEAIGFLARGNGWTVKYSIISPASFKSVVQEYSALGTEVKEVLDVASDSFVKTKERQSVKREAVSEDVIKSAPISKMVDVILKHAVDAGASDVHIEPVMEETRVRYRIDGVLHTTLVLPKYLHASLVSRVKVVANLKIDETRIPQDGRIRMMFGGKNIDFRVSTLPLYSSEKVVMRILDIGERTPTLEGMGFWGRNLTIMQENIKKPHGMFLVTGPTGSGKSTTLFGVLNILNEEGVNIITLEDPVEYYLNGVNQSQINAEIGYTFSAGLRSILRQDPDIIMVGEIRDNETAELAIHAALTGHIVLSTLHTNDAMGAIPRLVDMKVEPFLLASTVNVVIAQRLVRKICDFCKVVESPPQEIEKELRAELKEMPQSSVPSELQSGVLTIAHGAGCARCEGTGYSGRTTISEVIAMTNEMKEIIATGSRIENIKKEFTRQGLLTLKQDGILKVLKGLTSLEEILTATKE